MTKKILKVLFLNMIIVAIAVTIYALGYEYDKANELYPEAVFFASDASISTYGQRWSRLSRFILILLIIFDFVAILQWYRQRQIKEVEQNKIFFD